VKKSAYVLVTLLFLSFVILYLPKTSVNASSTELASIFKPSAPEFTVNLVNETIEVKIKNQPFVSYYDTIINWTIDFYYNIRIKGNSLEDWTELYLIEDVPTRSISEYTELSYALVGENTYNLGDKIMEFPDGSQVDFQVEAMIGYVHRVYNPNATSQLEMYPYVFTGETSGWSATRTITIPEQEPHQTEVIEIILAIVLIVTVIGAGLLIYFKKRHHVKINKHSVIEQSSTPFYK